MAVVPTKIPDKISWYQQRETAWTSHATAIGISASEMTSMTAKISAASDALDAHNAARNAAKSATVALYQAVRDMGDMGASLIKKIRAKAEQDGNDNPYILSNVPPPATPSPVGELAKPTDFKVTLDETGAISLAWKCAQPKSATAVTYQVWRRVGNAGAWACLGGTGTKKFADNTVPAGSASVTYKIQATRSTSVGPWAQYTVSFGVEGGEATIASVVETTPTGPKMAA